MSQLLSQSWLGRLCDAFDRALIDLNVLPRRTRTEGKSLLLGKFGVGTGLTREEREGGVEERGGVWGMHTYQRI